MARHCCESDRRHICVSCVECESHLLDMRQYIRGVGATCALSCFPFVKSFQHTNAVCVQYLQQPQNRIRWSARGSHGSHKNNVSELRKGVFREIAVHLTQRLHRRINTCPHCHAARTQDVVINAEDCRRRDAQTNIHSLEPISHVCHFYQ